MFLSRMKDPAHIIHHQLVMSPSFGVIWFSLGALSCLGGIDSEVGIAKLGAQWETMSMSVCESGPLLGMCLK